jgi:glycosyltransferase involved in cell wall biosynthesis/predicted O-methyltransferase YrrM
MTQVLNNEYFCMDEEFSTLKHEAYDTLKILQDLGELEREVGLLQYLFTLFDDLQFIHINTNYGGYLPIKLLSATQNIYLTHYNNNIIQNCKVYDSDNHIKLFNTILHNNVIIKYEKEYYPICDDAIIITYYKINICNHTCFTLTNSNMCIYVPSFILDKFTIHFQHLILGNVLENVLEINYNNLIHMCMIVRNAGDGFEDILRQNLPFVDQWTILDTGSTDNTVDIINNVMNKNNMGKNGRLYEEPFINFRDSRNRCLELAKQHNYCKYFFMLDDTYVLKGQPREFLNLIRGDQFADSYNIFIQSNGTMYGSNRLIKADKNLKYIYLIHEIIEKNVVVQIPHHEMYIEDISSDYMIKRTMDRKQYDLTLLDQMLEEDPTNPRTLFYLTQTYVELEEWDKVLYYADLRIHCKTHGYDEEITECYLIIANITQHIQKKELKECKNAYKQCFQHDILKPDALYCIGRLYIDNHNPQTAYKYMKKAFELGYPIHIGANVRDYLYNELIPYELVSLCYTNEDYVLGLKAANKYLACHEDTTITSYKNIFYLLVENKLCDNKCDKIRKYHNVICFVADGGFKEWHGGSIYHEGVGGSETYIIEMARNIAFITGYKVVVFCHTSRSIVCDNVKYKNLNKYIPFINRNHIHTSFISRYSEYIPVTIKNNVDNIYLVVHDLTPTGNIIPIHDKVKGIFCMSDWHKNYLSAIYPTLSNIDIFPNGINIKEFTLSHENKVPNSFIYSSFPNRGLIHLLRMFPKIRTLIPDATLHVFCDMDNAYCLDVAKEEMMNIITLLEEQKEYITNYGFVSKKILYDVMQKSDIWLYPCTFEETFCITALEAQMAGCLCISNDLGALIDVNKGIIIKGDASTLAWQEEAINTIMLYIVNNKKKYIIDNCISKKNIVDNKKYIIDNCKAFVSEYDWHVLAQKMVVNYIGKDLVYCDMYNWTNDVPKGSKEIFLKVLDQFIGKKCHMLEIGTYTGTSIIHMLHYLNDATATVIDLWEDYEELSVNMLSMKDVFNENLLRGNVQERVKVIVGDSKDVLMDLIKMGKHYDFIYVDGSHQCLDCYSDMIMAWNLLSPGGIMGIDDYLWQGKNNTILDYPHDGIDFFIKRYKNIKVIDIGYRVFLQKI